jgi:ATP-dependent Clp protease adaptor protein ClpS
MPTKKPSYEDPHHEEGVSTAARPKTKKPRRFKVLLHNDDYTTMDFVVEILMTFFGKGATEATHIMLTIHRLGVGVAGVYPKDVAETKVAEVSDYARGQGHPLLLTIEPE